MSAISFVSLKDDQNSEIEYRLRAEWLDNSSNITLLVKSPVAMAYSGKITEEEAKNQSKSRKWSVPQYFNECRKSLGTERNPDEYAYQMQGNVFIIKKNTKGARSMKVIIASIKLEKIDLHQTTFEIFDGAMSRIQELTIEVESLKKEKESANQNYKNAVEQLNEMVEARTQSEKVLYSRFLLLLNSKKVKIASLKALDQHMNTSEITDMELENASSDDSAYSVDTNVDEKEGQEKSQEVDVKVSPIKQVVNMLEETVSLPETDVKPALQEAPAGSSDVSEPLTIDNILDSMSFLDPTVPFRKTK